MRKENPHQMIPPAVDHDSQWPTYPIITFDYGGVLILSLFFVRCEKRLKKSCVAGPAVVITLAARGLEDFFSAVFRKFPPAHPCSAGVVQEFGW
jgi:hypothetical protein